MKKNFDVIVIGSGMSGGWAAKEFCEKGMKTLVIERGRDVRHGVDYVGENKNPWDMPFRDLVDQKTQKEQYPVQSQCYAFSESTKHFFANDNDLPYQTKAGKPYTWIRGNHLGGRSMMWQRQVYRWSDLDFAANKKENVAIDWPIRYDDIAPWYDYVEEFVGVSGSVENLPHVPDGVFQPPMALNCVEKAIKTKLEDTFDERKLIIGRCAHLTKPTQEQMELGRVACQNRAQCQRGCSFGAFFNSVNATLPAAQRTKNLTKVTDSLVTNIIYDAQKKRATGVEVINTKDNTATRYYAKTIFVCASTLGTVQLLLNSRSEAFPNGLANNSGVLGHYLMDHHLNVGASGKYPGFKNKHYTGRRPTGIYIPRFRNIDGYANNDFLRGYNFQGGAVREHWEKVAKGKEFGADLKQKVEKPGDWVFSINGFGETLPYFKNKATLDTSKKDKWGMAQLKIDCGVFDNEQKMRKDMKKTAKDMLEKAGLTDIQTFEEPVTPGLCIHEMGGARMGNSPKESVLNKYNQTHDIQNVFVTDGSAMTSSACQNPSITYMALTARAVGYAVNQMKEGRL